MQPAVQPAVEQGLVECDVESFHRVCPEQERGIDWLELFTLACANCFDSACFEHANLLVRLSTALDVLNSEENYAWECNVGVAAVAMMAQHLFTTELRARLGLRLRLVPQLGRALLRRARARHRLARGERGVRAAAQHRNVLRRGHRSQPHPRRELGLRCELLVLLPSRFRREAVLASGGLGVQTTGWGPGLVWRKYAVRVSEHRFQSNGHLGMGGLLRAPGRDAVAVAEFHRGD